MDITQSLVTQWRGTFFINAWINGLVNNRAAGDLRRHRAHYDVTVMWTIRKHQAGASVCFIYLWYICMITSWHGNVFRVTGPLWGESTKCTAVFVNVSTTESTNVNLKQHCVEPLASLAQCLLHTAWQRHRWNIDPELRSNTPLPDPHWYSMERWFCVPGEKKLATWHHLSVVSGLINHVLTAHCVLCQQWHVY